MGVLQNIHKCNVTEVQQSLGLGIAKLSSRWQVQLVKKKKFTQILDQEHDVDRIYDVVNMNSVGLVMGKFG